MHHHEVSAAGRAISRILLVERAALFLASLALILLFWDVAQRYFKSLAFRRAPEFSDQLGAGIWLAAVGMVLSDFIRLMLTTVWRGTLDGYPVAMGFMALGVLIILVGYLLHFMSYVGAVHPALKRLSLYWTLGLALACAAVITWALY